MTGSKPAEKQKTLLRESSLSGIGLFTGVKANLKLCPAPPDSGIGFERVDLPGRPKISAALSSVRDAVRCTRIATAEASIQMVEHLLSALYAMGVDNARIELDGPEVPAADGSALPFVEMIEKSGLEIQDRPRKAIRLKQPLFWSEGDAHIVALPADEFRLSYTISYPQSPLVKSQYYSFSLNPESFKKQIASCRTFSLYEEIMPFIEKGIIKGGGLENALVIKGDQVLNPGGVRFEDEMVRHKILDLLGDLSLIGAPLCAHVIAIRSGHASHIAFAKILSTRAMG